MMHSIPVYLALSVGEFMSFSLSFAAAAGLVFVVIVGITSYLRFEFMTQPVGREEGEQGSTDAFQFQILQRLGSGTKTPSPFGLVLIRSSTPVEEAVLQQAVRILEQHVREEDVVHIGEEGSLALLLSAPGRRVDGIVQRIAEIPELLKGIPSLHMSSVSFPENGSQYRELLEEAESGFEKLEASAGRYWTAPRAEDAAEGGAAPSELLDPLTGVLKPDRMISTLQRFVARHRKEETAVSLIYLDVDSMERYNRLYGREGGDAVLRQLGALIDARFRETDLVGRYEGEEFLVAVSCPVDRALLSAKRFSADVKKYPFEFEARNLKITVSAGVAGFPEHGHVPRELFDAASAAMLAAKNRGHGSVVRYEKGMSVPDNLEKKIERI